MDRSPPASQDRRQALRLLRSGLVLSAASSLAPSVLHAAPRRQPVALLLPLTGASATLGLSMQRAAGLVQPIDARGDLMVFDTGGTPAGAAAAAAQALKRRARLVLGPLFTAEVRPVLAVVAGRVPVVTFSNDSNLRESGAFMMGITPSQATAAILRYARQRGIRRLGVVTGDGLWAEQCAATVRRLEGELGLSVSALHSGAAPAPATLLPALARLAGGDLPDAVLLPTGGAGALELARAFTAAGVQVLGTLQTIEHTPAALSALDGGWFAMPDPTAFNGFARDFAARNGGAPGAIAALAYDAAGIATSLQKAGSVDRAALLATAFPGVTGAIRFRADGSAMREFAIVVAGANGYSTVDTSSAA